MRTDWCPYAPCASKNPLHFTNLRHTTQNRSEGRAGQKRRSMTTYLRVTCTNPRKRNNNTARYAVNRSTGRVTPVQVRHRDISPLTPKEKQQNKITKQARPGAKK